MRDDGCDEQILYHIGDAHRFVELLESGVPPVGRRAGRGGSADDAQPCPQYGVADRLHTSGQGKGDRLAEQRAGEPDKLQPLTVPVTFPYRREKVRAVL